MTSKLIEDQKKFTFMFNFNLYLRSYGQLFVLVLLMCGKNLSNVFFDLLCRLFVLRDLIFLNKFISNLYLCIEINELFYSSEINIYFEKVKIVENKLPTCYLVI